MRPELLASHELLNNSVHVFLWSHQLSPKYSIYTLFNATECDLFIVMQRTNIKTNVLQRFVNLQEHCTIFNVRKINHSCLFVYCASMRLLLNLYHCTTVAYIRKIYCNIQCVYTVQRSLWILRVLYEYFFLRDYFSNSLQIISIFSVRAPVVKGA